MPIDWITLIHKERMNNKPHTEQAKDKMRASHALVSQRPDIIKARSLGGITGWASEKKDAHAKAISEARKRVFAKEREEQEARNEINRIKVAQYLERTANGNK